MSLEAVVDALRNIDNTDADAITHEDGSGLKYESDEVDERFDFIVTDERPDLSSEMPCPRSQFAAVIFHDIPETYSADVDVECHYSLTADISPSTRDWVGLYRVGWMSCRDYVYYEWAPVPESIEIPITITFSRKQLPPDNGEFYQYCYVTRSGQIRGASTPFQFRRPRADDFVEIEDEDDDLLVIRPSKVVLEEKLRDAEDGHKKLHLLYTSLEHECDQARTNLVKASKELQQEKKAKKNVKTKLLKSEDAYREMSVELTQFRCKNDELSDHLAKALQGAEGDNKKVGQLKDELEVASTSVKALQNERDELAGINQSLVEEKELYKNTLASLETRAAGHVQNVESLKKQLKVCESRNADLSMMVTEKLQQHQATSQETELKLVDVLEQLSQAENKLNVCEARKVMLTKELEAYNETQQKMSRDLENSEMDSFNLREQIKQLSDAILMLNDMVAATKDDKIQLVEQVTLLTMESSKIPQLVDEIAALNVCIEGQKTVAEELVVARERIGELEGSVEGGTGSLFALQMAHNALKTRLTKYKTAYDEARKQRDNFIAIQNLHIERENELKRELEDSKERIMMCTSEYKSLYHKYTKLERRHMKKMNRDSKDSDNLTTDNDDTGQSEDDLGDETKMAARVRDSGNKDQILLMKKQQFDLQADCDTKIRYMENVLDQKEVEILELRRSLATAKADCPPQTGDIVYPVMVYDNPYVTANFPTYPYPTQMLPHESVMTVSPSLPQHDALVDPANQHSTVSTHTDVTDQGETGEARRLSLINIPIDHLTQTDISLDPPLTPHVTTTAKVAAIKSVYNADRNEVTTVTELYSDETIEETVIGRVDVVDNDEDRFQDAAGESMKICPTCDASFPVDISDADFEMHLFSHFGHVCPMCHCQMDNSMAQSEFEAHVQRHFTEEDHPWQEVNRADPM